MSEAKIESRLTPLDWVASIACWPVGCGLGLYYLINGNPKAGKMLLVSILVSVLLIAAWVVVIAAGVFQGR